MRQCTSIRFVVHLPIYDRSHPSRVCMYVRACVRELVRARGERARVADRVSHVCKED